MGKIAVLFPGIGYTNDKPLMYYAKKMLMKNGFEVVDVNYKGFDNGIKGNKEKMLDAVRFGVEQADEILSGVAFAEYEEIVFVSKSIGTAIAVEYALRHKLSTKNVYLTPLEFTFADGMGDGIAFTGDSDPWVTPGAVAKKCREYGIPVTVIEGGNHSLEMGDIQTDIENLKMIEKKVAEYLELR